MTETGLVERRPTALVRWIALVLALVMVGCAAPAPTPPSTPAPQPQPEPERQPEPEPTGELLRANTWLDRNFSVNATREVHADMVLSPRGGEAAGFFPVKGYLLGPNGTLAYDGPRMYPGGGGLNLWLKGLNATPPVEVELKLWSAVDVYVDLSVTGDPAGSAASP